MRAGYLAAAVCVLIWGANYSIAKRALMEVDPFAVACARAAAGILFFGGLLLLRHGTRGGWSAAFRRALPLGLLGIFANQLLFMTGLKRTSAAHSAILIGMLPIFVLLLSSLLHQEKITPPKMAGVLIAFAGVLLIALEHGIAFEAPHLPGDVLTLFGVLAFAGYTVLGRPILREIGPYDTTGLAFLSGGPFIVLLTLPAAVHQDWRSVSPTGYLSLAFVVGLSTIAAYVLYSLALERLEPSKVAVFMYLQPIVAAVIAFGLAGERLTGAFLLGGVLVLAGVLLAERA